MMRRLVDLKEYYGKETLMEVLETNLEARRLIFSKTVHRDHRTVILTYREEHGLVALDTHPCGHGVIIKLSEDYLSTFMLLDDDFYDIVCVPWNERPRRDWSEAMKAAEEVRDDNSNRNEILGWGSLALLTVTLTSIYFIRNEFKSDSPSSPPPMKGKRK